MIQWQKPKSRPWLRMIAFLTTVFFTTTSVLWADPAALHKSPQALPAAIPSPQESSSSLFGQVNLPESIGQVKKNFQGSRDRIVIHIQDAHANEEAQRNIAGILDYFASQHQLKLVSLEGAEGRLRTELFTIVPDQKARQYVSDYFLKEARLTGPEYEAIVNRPDLVLYGIEDRAVYEKNRQAYLEALDFKERDEKVLAALEKVLQDVSRFVFPEELRELRRRRESFQEGSHELVSYVRYLVETAKKRNISLYEYPGLHSLLELIQLEGEINFEKADQEIENLSSDLKKILSHERLSEFVTNTVQFRMQKMKRAEYYGYLETVIKSGIRPPKDGSAFFVAENPKHETNPNVSKNQKTNVSDLGHSDLNVVSKFDIRNSNFSYENVLKYLRYSQLYDSIKVELFDEIEAIEKVIKDKYFISEEQVQLDRLFRVFEIYQKMFEFSLTKQDADFFYTYRGDFNVKGFRSFLDPLLKKHRFSYGLPEDLEVLDQDLPRVEQFYELALTRDRILIERAMEKMEKDDAKIMAIVTGGFHTPGIEKYLREHDYSYLVIMPRISKAIDAKKENLLYQNSLKQKLSPLESKLAEAYFPPVSKTLNDPHFQLAAPLGAPDDTINPGSNLPKVFIRTATGAFIAANFDDPASFNAFTETIRSENRALSFGGVFDRKRSIFWQPKDSQNVTGDYDAFRFVHNADEKKFRAEVRNLDRRGAVLAWGEDATVQVLSVEASAVPHRVVTNAKETEGGSRVVVISDVAAVKPQKKATSLTDEEKAEFLRVAKERLRLLQKWYPELIHEDLKVEENWWAAERNALQHYLILLERELVTPGEFPAEKLLPRNSKSTIYTARVKAWIQAEFQQAWETLQSFEKQAEEGRRHVGELLKGLTPTMLDEGLDAQRQNAVMEYLSEEHLAKWNQEHPSLQPMSMQDLWNGNPVQYAPFATDEAGNKDTGIHYDHLVLKFLVKHVAGKNDVAQNDVAQRVATNLSYQENGMIKNILLENINHAIREAKTVDELKSIVESLEAIPPSVSDALRQSLKNQETETEKITPDYFFKPAGTAPEEFGLPALKAKARARIREIERRQKVKDFLDKTYVDPSESEKLDLLNAQLDGILVKEKITNEDAQASRDAANRARAVIRKLKPIVDQGNLIRQELRSNGENNEDILSSLDQLLAGTAEILTKAREIIIKDEIVYIREQIEPLIEEARAIQRDILVSHQAGQFSLKQASDFREKRIVDSFDVNVRERVMELQTHMDAPALKDEVGEAGLTRIHQELNQQRAILNGEIQKILPIFEQALLHQVPSVVEEPPTPSAAPFTLAADQSTLKVDQASQQRKALLDLLASAIGPNVSSETLAEVLEPATHQAIEELIKYAQEHSVGGLRAEQAIRSSDDLLKFVIRMEREAEQVKVQEMQEMLIAVIAELDEIANRLQPAVKGREEGQKPSPQFLNNIAERSKSIFENVNTLSSDLEELKKDLSGEGDFKHLFKDKEAVEQITLALKQLENITANRMKIVMERQNYIIAPTISRPQTEAIPFDPSAFAVIEAKLEPPEETPKAEPAAPQAPPTPVVVRREEVQPAAVPSSAQPVAVSPPQEQPRVVGQRRQAEKPWYRKTAFQTVLLISLFGGMALAQVNPHVAKWVQKAQQTAGESFAFLFGKNSEQKAKKLTKEELALQKEEEFAKEWSELTVKSRQADRQKIIIERNLNDTVNALQDFDSQKGSEAFRRVIDDAKSKLQVIKEMPLTPEQDEKWKKVVAEAEQKLRDMIAAEIERKKILYDLTNRLAVSEKDENAVNLETKINTTQAEHAALGVPSYQEQKDDWRKLNRGWVETLASAKARLYELKKKDTLKQAKQTELVREDLQGLTPENFSARLANLGRLKDEFHVAARKVEMGEELIKKSVLNKTIDDIWYRIRALPVWGNQEPMTVQDMQAMPRKVMAEKIKGFTVPQILFIINNDKHGQDLFKSPIFVPEIVHATEKDFNAADLKKFTEKIRPRIEKWMAVAFEGQQYDLETIDWYARVFPQLFIMLQIEEPYEGRFMDYLIQIWPRIIHFYATHGVRSQKDMFPDPMYAVGNLFKDEPYKDKAMSNFKMLWRKNQKNNATLQNIPFEMLFGHAVAGAGWNLGVDRIYATRVWQPGQNYIEMERDKFFEIMGYDAEMVVGRFKNLTRKSLVWDFWYNPYESLLKKRVGFYERHYNVKAFYSAIPDIDWSYNPWRRMFGRVRPSNDWMGATADRMRRTADQMEPTADWIGSSADWIGASPNYHVHNPEEVVSFSQALVPTFRFNGYWNLVLSETLQGNPGAMQGVISHYNSLMLDHFPSLSMPPSLPMRAQFENLSLYEMDRPDAERLQRARIISSPLDYMRYVMPQTNYWNHRAGVVNSERYKLVNALPDQAREGRGYSNAFALNILLNPPMWSKDHTRQLHSLFGAPIRKFQVLAFAELLKSRSDEEIFKQIYGQKLYDFLHDHLSDEIFKKISMSSARDGYIIDTQPGYLTTVIAAVEDLIKKEKLPPGYESWYSELMRRHKESPSPQTVTDVYWTTFAMMLDALISPKLEGIRDAYVLGERDPSVLTPFMLYREALLEIITRIHKRELDLKDPDDSGLLSSVHTDMYFARMNDRLDDPEDDGRAIIYMLYLELKTRDGDKRSDGTVEENVVGMGLDIFNTVLGNENDKRLKRWDFGSKEVGAYHNAFMNMWNLELIRDQNAYTKWMQFFKDDPEGRRFEQLLELANIMADIEKRPRFTRKELQDDPWRSNRLNKIIPFIQSYFNSMEEKDWDKWYPRMQQSLVRIKTAIQKTVSFQAKTEETKPQPEVKAFDPILDSFYIYQGLRGRPLEGDTFQKEYQEYLKAFLQGHPDIRGSVISWTQTLVKKRFNFKTSNEMGEGKSIAKLIQEVGMNSIVNEVNLLWGAIGRSLNIKYPEIKNPAIPKNLDEMHPESHGRLTSFLNDAIKEDWTSLRKKNLALRLYLEAMRRNDELILPGQPTELRRALGEAEKLELAFMGWKEGQEKPSYFPYIEHLSNPQVLGSFISWAREQALFVGLGREAERILRESEPRNRSEMRVIRDLFKKIKALVFGKQREFTLSRRNFLEGGIVAAAAIGLSGGLNTRIHASENQANPIEDRPVGVDFMSVRSPIDVAPSYNRIGIPNAILAQIAPQLPSPSPAIQPVTGPLEKSWSEIYFEILQNPVKYDELINDVVTLMPLIGKKGAELTRQMIEAGIRSKDQDITGLVTSWARNRIESGWEATHDLAQRVAKVYEDVQKREEVFQEAQALANFQYGDGFIDVRQSLFAEAETPQKRQIAQGIIISWTRFRVSADIEIELSFNKTKGAAEEMIETLNKISKEPTFGPQFFATAYRLFKIHQMEDLASVTETKYLENFRESEASWNFLSGLMAALIIEFREGLSHQEGQISTEEKFAVHATNLLHMLQNTRPELEAFYKTINRPELLDINDQDSSRRQQVWGEFASRLRVVEVAHSTYKLSPDELHQALKNINETQKAAMESGWKTLEDAEAVYFYRLFFLGRRDGSVLARGSEPFSRLRNTLDIKDFFKLINFIQHVEFEAGQTLLRELSEWETNPSKRPLWLSKNDLANLKTQIKGDPDDNIEGLMNRRVIPGEAVTLGIQFMLQQGQRDPEERENLNQAMHWFRDRSRRMTFSQAVYVNYHVDSQGNPERMPVGDLAPYLNHIATQSRTLDEVGRIFKIQGLILKTYRELLVPKTIAEINAIRSHNGQPQLTVREQQVIYKTFPDIEEESIGMAANIGQLQDLGRVGVSDREIVTFLEYWAQDTAYIQAQNWNYLNHEFLPFVVSNAVVDINRKGEEKFTARQRTLIKGRKQTTDPVDITYQDLGSPEANRLRNMRRNYFVVYRKFLPLEREAWWNHHLSSLETQIKSVEVSTPAKIEAMKFKFMMHMRAASESFTEIVAPALYEKGVDIDSKKVRDAQSQFEGVVAEKIISNLVDWSARLVRIQVLRDKIFAEENVLIPQMHRAFQEREKRKIENQELLSNSQKRREVADKIVSLLRPIKLGHPDIQFLINQMVQLGYTVDEALFRFVTLPRMRFPDVHKRVYGQDLDWRKDPGKVTSFTDQVFSRWGFVGDENANFRRAITAGLFDAVSQGLTTVSTVEDGIKDELKDVEEKYATSKIIQGLLEKYGGIYQDPREREALADRIASDAKSGGLLENHFKNWMEIAIELRKILKGLDIERTDKEVLFRTDSILRLGVAELYQDPLHEKAVTEPLRKIIEEHFGDMFQTAGLARGVGGFFLGSSYEAELGRQISQNPKRRQEIVDQLIKVMQQKQIRPVDIKLLFMEANKIKQELDTQRKEIASRDWFDEDAGQIPDLSLPEILIYLDLTATDPLKKLGLRQILFSSLPNSEIVRLERKVGQALNEAFRQNEMKRFKEIRPKPDRVWIFNWLDVEQTKVAPEDRFKGGGFRNILYLSGIVVLAYGAYKILTGALRDPLTGLIKNQDGQPPSKEEMAQWSPTQHYRLDLLLFNTLVNFGMMFLTLWYLGIFMPYAFAFSGIAAAIYLFFNAYLLRIVVPILNISASLVYNKATAITFIWAMGLATLVYGPAAIYQAALLLIKLWPVLIAMGVYLALWIRTSDWYKAKKELPTGRIIDQKAFNLVNASVPSSPMSEVQQRSEARSLQTVVNPEIVKKIGSIFRRDPTVKYERNRIDEKNNWHEVDVLDIEDDEVVTVVRPWLMERNMQAHDKKIDEIIERLTITYRGHSDRRYREIFQLNGPMFNNEDGADFTTTEGYKNLESQNIKGGSYDAVKNNSKPESLATAEEKKLAQITYGEYFERVQKKIKPLWDEIEEATGTPGHERVQIFVMPGGRKPFLAARKMRYFRWGEDGTPGHWWGQKEYEYRTQLYQNGDRSPSAWKPAKMSDGTWDETSDWMPIRIQIDERVFWLGLPHLVNEMVREKNENEPNLLHLALTPLFMTKPFFSGIIGPTEDQPFIPWEEAKELDFMQVYKPRELNHSRVKAWGNVDDNNWYAPGGGLYLMNTIVHQDNLHGDHHYARGAGVEMPKFNFFQGKTDYYLPFEGVWAFSLMGHQGQSAHTSLWFMQQIWAKLLVFLRLFGKYASSVYAADDLFAPRPGFPIGMYATRLWIMSGLLLARLEEYQYGQSGNLIPRINSQKDLDGAYTQIIFNGPNSEDEIVSYTSEDSIEIWAKIKREKGINRKADKHLQPLYEAIRKTNIPPNRQVSPAMIERPDGGKIIMDDRPGGKKFERERYVTKWMPAFDAFSFYVEHIACVVGLSERSRTLTSLVTRTMFSDPIFLLVLVMGASFILYFVGVLEVYHVMAAWYLNLVILAGLIHLKYTAPMLRRIEEFPTLQLSEYREFEFKDRAGRWGGLAYGFGLGLLIGYFIPFTGAMPLAGVLMAFIGLKLGGMKLVKVPITDENDAGDPGVNAARDASAVGESSTVRRAELRADNKPGINSRRFFKQLFFAPIPAIYSLIIDGGQSIGEFIASNPSFLPQVMTNPPVVFRSLLGVWRFVFYGLKGTAWGTNKPETFTEPVWEFNKLAPAPFTMASAIAIIFVGGHSLGFPAWVLSSLGTMIGFYLTMVLFTSDDYVKSIEDTAAAYGKSEIKGIKLGKHGAIRTAMSLFGLGLRNWFPSMGRGIRDVYRKTIGKRHVFEDGTVKRVRVNPNAESKLRDWALNQFWKGTFWAAMPAAILLLSGLHAYAMAQYIDIHWIVLFSPVVVAFFVQLYADWLLSMHFKGKTAKLIPYVNWFLGVGSLVLASLVHFHPLQPWIGKYHELMLNVPLAIASWYMGADSAIGLVAPVLNVWWGFVFIHTWILSGEFLLFVIGFFGGLYHALFGEQDPQKNAFRESIRRIGFTLTTLNVLGLVWLGWKDRQRKNLFLDQITSNKIADAKSLQYWQQVMEDITAQQKAQQAQPAPPAIAEPATPVNPEVPITPTEKTTPRRAVIKRDPGKLIFSWGEWQVLGAQDTDADPVQFALPQGDFSELKIRFKKNQVWSVKSNYLRATLPGHEWGTSFVTFASWRGGKLHFGADLKEATLTVDDTGRFVLKGWVVDDDGTLAAEEYTIVFQPPTGEGVQAEVNFELKALKPFKLDDKENENLRVMQLSSSHEPGQPLLSDVDRVEFTQNGTAHTGSLNRTGFIFKNPKPISAGDEIAFVSEDEKWPTVFIRVLEGNYTPQGYIENREGPDFDDVGGWLQPNNLPTSFNKNDRVGKFHFLIGARKPSGRSELRKMEPEGGQDSLQSLKGGLKSIAAMKLSVDQMRKEIPDFDERLTGWLADEAIVEQLSIMTGIPIEDLMRHAILRGHRDIFVDWAGIVNADFETRDVLIQDIKEEAGLKAKIVIFAKPEDFNDVSQHYVDATQIRVVAIGDLDAELEPRMKELGMENGYQNLVQIITDISDVKVIRTALLSAVPLSEGTIQLLGFDQPVKPGVRLITIDQIVQAVYLAAQAVARSA